LTKNALVLARVLNPVPVTIKVVLTMGDDEIFDKLVIEAQKKIAEDLKIEETIDLFDFSRRETLKRFKKKARESGSLELATIGKLSDWRLKEWLFGREEWHTKYTYTKRYFFGR
jgi:hypothetical protein